MANMQNMNKDTALRLAAELDDGYPLTGDAISAAAELRRQHARIAELEAQLFPSGFTATDMATASAQGFRDGVASVAASAGSEPVAYAMFADNGNIRLWSKARIPHPGAKPLYLHPSTPEGMVGRWTKPHRTITYTCPVCAASLERQE